MRDEIAKVFRVQHLESDGLQSGMIQTFLMVMQDPDLVVAKWLKDKAMPWGIDVPIVLGNVFMLTTEHSAKGALTSIGSTSQAKLPAEVKHPLNKLCKESLEVESSSAPKPVCLRAKVVGKSSTTKGDEALRVSLTRNESNDVTSLTVEIQRSSSPRPARGIHRCRQASIRSSSAMTHRVSSQSRGPD